MGPFLPAIITPIYYYLALQVYLNGFLDLPSEKVNTFKGTVRMMFLPNQDTDVFYLNSDGLTITTHKVYTTENVFISSVLVPKEDEQILEFKTKTKLLAGQFYLVEINYKGKMREDSSEGLYVSKDASTRQVAASTKFEPHFARRMVPCVDQPDAKAVWKVTIIHPKNTRAASNGERIKLIERKGWALTKFADSPRMSSYLLAIFVSDYAHLSSRTQSGIKVRLFAPNNTLQRYKSIFDYSVDRMDFYQKFFDADPGIKKLDQVVVNLGSAGMENWGLISLNAHSMQGERKLHTVAHELVHQWLGNQVTPHWWDDLWITEGLSTFIAEHLPYMGRVFQLYHSMHILLDYEANPDPNQGLILPLRTQIGVDELRRGKNAVMNYNVYNRGAMFAGMIHAVMGTEPFRKAVQAMVKRYSNSTITETDFVRTFNEFLDARDRPRDFHRFCKTWIEQPGHPLLNVETVPRGVKITQQRNFNTERIHPKYKGKTDFGYKYDVPIFYTTNKKESSIVWLYYDQESVTIPVETDEVISIDPFGEGMYKIHYDQPYYIKWAEICPEKKCQHDIFFKPCEEFVKIRDTYAPDLGQKVLRLCNMFDHAFGARHPGLRITA